MKCEYFEIDEVMKVWRLGSRDNFVGISERSVYSMRSVILSQWRE